MNDLQNLGTYLIPKDNVLRVHQHDDDDSRIIPETYRIGRLLGSNMASSATSSLTVRCQSFYSGKLVIKLHPNANQTEIRLQVNGITSGQYLYSGISMRSPNITNNFFNAALSTYASVGYVRDFAANGMATCIVNFNGTPGMDFIPFHAHTEGIKAPTGGGAAQNLAYFLGEIDRIEDPISSITITTPGSVCDTLELYIIV